jgi:cytochrome c oxidase subunit II
VLGFGIYEWSLRRLGLPVEASAHATRIDLIIALVHWLMLAMFVGWTIFFVYVLVRFRRGAHPKARYEGVSDRWVRLAGVGVVAAEVILLVFFSIPMWSDRVDAFPVEQEATVVRVVAEQFIWNVQYPGADGVFGRRALIWLDRTTLSASTSAIRRRGMTCGRRIN